MVRHHVFCVQFNVVSHLNSYAVSTRMCKGFSVLSSQTKLEGLPDIIDKPLAIAQILVIIRYINLVSGCHSRIHSIDTGEMSALRQRQSRRRKSSNICRCVRALHLLRISLGRLGGLGESRRRILALHGLEGAQNHRGLAMDLQCLSLGSLDMIRVDNRLHLFGQLDAVFRHGCQLLCLEQLLERRKEGLSPTKIPLSSL